MTLTIAKKINAIAARDLRRVDYWTAETEARAAEA